MVKLLQIATQHEKHPSCPETSAVVSVGVVGVKSALPLSQGLITECDRVLVFLQNWNAPFTGAGFRMTCPLYLQQSDRLPRFTNVDLCILGASQGFDTV
jgi:hypothetical protein